MRRREFIAALFAPFVARLLPKNVVYENMDVQSLWEENGPIVSSIVTSTRQSPGRIDFINLKDWVRIETRPSDYYDIGIAPIFPVNGIASSLTFKLVLESQIKASRS